MRREVFSPERVRPWPVAPRPFEDEAFGGWLGRLAAKYRIGVAQLWASGQLGAFPDLTRSGWLLFPPVDELVLARLSALNHVGVDRMVAIQTPAAWVSHRSNLPYCFECLVLNPIDVFSPRWKREWLNPAATACEVHGRRLETISSSTLLKLGNLNAVISRIGRGAGLRSGVGSGTDTMLTRHVRRISGRQSQN